MYTGHPPLSSVKRTLSFAQIVKQQNQHLQQQNHSATGTAKPTLGHNQQHIHHRSSIPAYNISDTIPVQSLQPPPPKPQLDLEFLISKLWFSYQQEKVQIPQSKNGKENECQQSKLEVYIYACIHTYIYIFI